MSEANGRFFVLETNLSKSLSIISFSIHQAERIKKTPKRNTTRIFLFGNPSEANHNAHNVGHNSRKIPIGRFSLISMR